MYLALAARRLPQQHMTVYCKFHILSPCVYIQAETLTGNHRTPYGTVTFPQIKTGSIH